MDAVLATVELKSTTGLPKDSVVNSFAIATDPTFSSSDFAEIATPLAQFYTDQFAGAGSCIADYMASNRSRAAGGAVIRLYDISDHLDGSPHGSPFAVTAFTLPPAYAANPLPSEMSVAVTLRAVTWGEQPVERADGADPDAKPDRPRQRYTGRLYLGTLDQRAVNAAGGVPRVEANFRAAILAAADDLDTVLTGTYNHSWSVWSRKDATLRSITDVQVDNAFDVQRRRGEASTARDTVATG